jgi:hypothetical protein
VGTYGRVGVGAYSWGFLTGLTKFFALEGREIRGW